MDPFAQLPASVGVCTNVASLPMLPERTITNADLTECFLSVRRSNTHTQPLPSDSGETKRLLSRLDAFHSSQLTPFLHGYTYPNRPIPDSVLSTIRTLCVNSDSDWVCRCQTLALDILVRELQAKGTGVIPRSKLDDPVAVAQVRQAIPGMKRVPRVAMGQCSFRFVGVFSADPAVNEEVFAATVKVQNKGDHPFTLELSQAQTVIDGVRVENGFLQSSVQRQELKRGESVDIRLSIKEAPREGFTELQQILVIAVDGVLKLFVTYSVVSLRQGLFGQRFPTCLPLSVVKSPLGEYSAPLMLQMLKHVFIRRQGLSSPSVIRLMTDRATDYRAHNQETMREVMRAKEILSSQVNLSDVLGSYWASQPDAAKAPKGRSYKLPVSSAQPAGFLPGIDLPTGSTSSAAKLFPNAYTKLPDYLTKAPPDVTMGLILLWLAEMDVRVFELAFSGGDSVSYLEVMPPYLRGIVLWILDLCCALLQNRAVNGATERGLAITFASVLTRPDPSRAEEDDTGDVEMDESATEAFRVDSFARQTAGGPPQHTRSLTRELAIRQSTVTALLNWICLYNSRFSRAL